MLLAKLTAFSQKIRVSMYRILSIYLVLAALIGSNSPNGALITLHPSQKMACLRSMLVAYVRLNSPGTQLSPPALRTLALRLKLRIRTIQELARLLEVPENPFL